MRVARVLDGRSGRQRFAVVSEFGARHCNVTAHAVWADPAHAETALVNAESICGNIAVVRRGAGAFFRTDSSQPATQPPSHPATQPPSNSTGFEGPLMVWLLLAPASLPAGVSFIDKARRAAEAGASALIVLNERDLPFVAQGDPSKMVRVCSSAVVCPRANLTSGADPQDDFPDFPVVCIPLTAGEELLSAVCADAVAGSPRPLVTLCYDPEQTLTVRRLANPLMLAQYLPLLPEHRHSYGDLLGSAGRTVHGGPRSREGVGALRSPPGGLRQPAD